MHSRPECHERPSLEPSFIKELRRRLPSNTISGVFLSHGIAVFLKSQQHADRQGTEAYFTARVICEILFVVKLRKLPEHTINFNSHGIFLVMFDVAHMVSFSHRA
jgi:hypothetical protein